MIVFCLLFIALGLTIGSFLNVLIYRLPREIKFTNDRSFCPRCKKKISWYDNIPLLSYLLLKGKCRNCKKHISLRYPLVELLTALLFVYVFNGLWSTDYGLLNMNGLLSTDYGLLNMNGLLSTDYGLQSVIKSFLTIILFCSLIVIFFSDLETQIIPDEILIPTTVVFLIFSFIPLPSVPTPLTNFFPNILLPPILSFLFFWLIYLLTKGRGMGFGDVKFAFFMGLVLGFPKIILALYLSFLTGAFVGAILLLTKKAKLKQKIAFGPFLAGSTLLVYLFGDRLLPFFQKAIGF